MDNKMGNMTAEEKELNLAEAKGIAQDMQRELNEAAWKVDLKDSAMVAQSEQSMDKRQVVLQEN